MVWNLDPQKSFFIFILHFSSNKSMYDFGANWDCSKKELERKRHFEAFFPSILSLFAGVCSDHEKIIGRGISNLLSLSVEFKKSPLVGIGRSVGLQWLGGGIGRGLRPSSGSTACKCCLLCWTPEPCFITFTFWEHFLVLSLFTFYIFGVRGQVQMLPSGPQNLVSRSLLFITFTLLQPFPCIVALEVMIALI